MGKSAPAAPAAPDYVGAAKQQGVENVETARVQAKLNNPNTYTPYGTQLVSYDGDQATIRQTLNPQAQRTLEEQQNTQYQLASLSGKGADLASGVLDKPFAFGGPAVQTSLDLSNIAKMPVNAGTTGQEAIMSRLEPSLARNRVSTETQLINQGLRPGTEFGNTAQQQALAQAIQSRQMPLNEITALMSGSQIQNPQFQAYSGSNIAAAPIYGATQQQGQFDQNTYNQQVAAQNQNTGGLYSLGAVGAKYALPKIFGA